jgi:hypothetical protein
MKRRMRGGRAGGRGTIMFLTYVLSFSKKLLRRELPSASKLLHAYFLNCFLFNRGHEVERVPLNLRLSSNRMPSSGILRRVALVRTHVSEDLCASIIRVTIIFELGTTLSCHPEDGDAKFLRTFCSYKSHTR